VPPNAHRGSAHPRLRRSRSNRRPYPPRPRPRVRPGAAHRRRTLASQHRDRPLCRWGRPSRRRLAPRSSAISPCPSASPVTASPSTGSRDTPSTWRRDCAGTAARGNDGDVRSRLHPGIASAPVLRTVGGRSPRSSMATAAPSMRPARNRTDADCGQRRRWRWRAPASAAL